MAIEIVDYVDFPIKNGDFPYFLYVYQRVPSSKLIDFRVYVNLPEGK